MSFIPILKAALKHMNAFFPITRTLVGQQGAASSLQVTSNNNHIKCHNHIIKVK